MACVTEFIVLALFVTCCAARYTQYEILQTPPEVLDDDYPTELARKIIANLTPEQLKLFNKDFLKDRDSDSADCPFRQDEIKPTQAVADDGNEYYLPTDFKTVQNFQINICLNGTSSRCKPRYTSSEASCVERSNWEKAYVIPVPVQQYKNVKKYYRSLDVIEKHIYIYPSECQCSIQSKME